MKINKKEEGQQSVKVKHATRREKKSERLTGRCWKRMKSGEGESRVEWSDSPHITCVFFFFFFFFFFPLQAIWRCSHQEQVRGRMRDGREEGWGMKGGRRGGRNKERNIALNGNQTHTCTGVKIECIDCRHGGKCVTVLHVCECVCVCV